MDEYYDEEYNPHSSPLGHKGLTSQLRAPSEDDIGEPLSEPSQDSGHVRDTQQERAAPLISPQATEEIIGHIREDGDGLPDDEEFIPSTKEEGGKRFAWCSDCAEWIGMGKSKNSSYQLEKHRGSGPCIKKQKKKGKLVPSAATASGKTAAQSWEPTRANASSASLANIHTFGSTSAGPYTTSSVSASAFQTAVAAPHATANPSAYDPDAESNDEWSFDPITVLSSPHPFAHIRPATSESYQQLAAMIAGSPKDEVPVPRYHFFGLAQSDSDDEGEEELSPQPASDSHSEAELKLSSGTPAPLTSRQALGCPGQHVDWDIPGNIFETYPFAIHRSEDLDFIPEAINSSAHYIVMRTRRCERQLAIDGQPCKFCRRIGDSAQVRSIKSRAVFVSKHTPYVYCNHVQLADNLRGVNNEVKRLRAKVRLHGLVSCFYAN